MSLSPKFISIKRSESGNATVLSKEVSEEYLIYKVSFNDEILRVKTDINNLLNNGDKCSLSLNKKFFIWYISFVERILQKKIIDDSFYIENNFPPELINQIESKIKRSGGKLYRKNS